MDNRSNYDTFTVYGISRDPITNDYLLVLQDEYYCEKVNNNAYQIDYLKNFTNWTSKNEKIDYFIQEIQPTIIFRRNMVFEWISFSQFNNVKEVSRDNYATIYLATWKDGPLCYDEDEDEYIRSPNKDVVLKCIHNSQNVSNDILNEV